MTETGSSSGGVAAVVSDLRALSGELESCAVVSAGGDLLFSSHPAGPERQRSKAMLSALVGLSSRVARQDGADASQVRIQTEVGHLLMVRLEDGGALAATVGPEARVGLALYDMRNASTKVSEAVSGANSGEGS